MSVLVTKLCIHLIQLVKVLDLLRTNIIEQVVNLQDKDNTMARFKILLAIVLLISVTKIGAQQPPMLLGNVKMAFLNSIPPNNYFNNNQSNFVGKGIKMKDTFNIKLAPNNILPTYYTEHLGMMCKEELKLEKVIKFPVKIRLGSKEQVDYLEGKFSQH